MSKETGKMPRWFRDADHEATAAGIVRRADRALLADDGLPASLALRAAEQRAADAAAQQTKEAKDGE